MAYEDWLPQPLRVTVKNASIDRLKHAIALQMSRPVPVERDTGAAAEHLRSSTADHRRSTWEPSQLQEGGVDAARTCCFGWWPSTTSRSHTAVRFYENSLRCLNAKIRSMQKEVLHASDSLERDVSMRIERIRSTTLSQCGDDDSGVNEAKSQRPPSHSLPSVTSPGFRRSDSMYGMHVMANGAIEFTTGLATAAQMLTIGVGKGSTGFVTFKRMMPVVLCRSLNISPHPMSLEAELAPGPSDIVWRNVAKSKTQGQIRGCAASVAHGVLALFWTGVIQSCFTLSQLGAQSFKKSSFLAQFITSVAPALLLSLLLALLPIFLKCLSVYYEDVKYYSRIETLVMTRFFTFQMVNIYILITNSSLSNAAKSITDHPGSALSILGGTLPIAAVYFVCFLCVKIFVTLPFELSRVFLVIRVAFADCLRSSKTRTARDSRGGPFSAPEFPFGRIYPSFMIVCVICCVYAPIAPAVCPFCWLYFMLANVVYRHQFLCVPLLLFPRVCMPD